MASSNNKPDSKLSVIVEIIVFLLILFLIYGLPFLLSLGSSSNYDPDYETWREQKAQDDWAKEQLRIQEQESRR